MCDPQIMCRKHLLGEHVELHMAAAWILQWKCIDGWVDGNCLEPGSIGKRHKQLAAEMKRRKYEHQSPLRQPLVRSWQRPSAKVDRAAALRELLRRCTDCRDRIPELTSKCWTRQALST
jgi:hypothetical protein